MPRTPGLDSWSSAEQSGFSSSGVAPSASRRSGARTGCVSVGDGARAGRRRRRRRHRVARLLLRSGIGGPAVGKYLKLHPAWFVGGVHDDPVDAWTGQIQSVTSHDFRLLPHGGGFLPECVILNLAFWTSSMPWLDGVSHKRHVLELATDVELARRDTGSWRRLRRSGARRKGHRPVGARRRARSRDGEARERRDMSSARSCRGALHLHVRSAGTSLEPRRGAVRGLRRPVAQRGLAAKRSPTRRTRCAAHAWDGTLQRPSPTDVEGSTTSMACGSATRRRSPRRLGVNPMIAVMALASLTAAHILEDAG